MFNLSLLLEDSARRHAELSAFTLGSSTWTYRTVNEKANTVACLLQDLGVKKGDRVALCSPNLLEFPQIYYGILKIGAIVVPLSVLFKKDEMKYHLLDSGAVAVFTFEGTTENPMGNYVWEAFQEVDTCQHFYALTPESPCPISGGQTFLELLEGKANTFISVPCAPEDTAVLVYTSGTTGAAKGACLSHMNLYTNAVVSADILESQTREAQLLVLPLFHIFGMTVIMNAGIYRAAHLVLLPKFDAQTAINLIEQHKIKVFAGVPAMYWALIHQVENPKDTKSLRLCVSGGASLPLSVLEGFEAQYKVPILEGYGMSEGSPVVTFNQLKIGRKPGSIGTPVWGVEVKLVNEEGKEIAQGEKGELIYRGPNVMKAYHNKPEESRAVLKEGWLHSGDIATQDSDGFYFIVDRKKDILIRAGFNVYPREVEETLMQHPAVSLAAVIGIPDERVGEEIKAFVVLKPGQGLSEEDLKAWCKARIANYKYPRKIAFIAQLPLSASGKILKRVLKEL